MSTLYRRFPGECIATFFLHIDPKTANMSQFLQLGPLDFDPDLGYVSYFWGIDSANNHSHISKPHPLNNTDTLGGRFPWPVTLSKCNWFLEHTPNLHIWRALPRSWDSFFLLVLLSMRSGNKDWKCSACSFVPNWDMLASWNSETMNNKWAAPVPLHLGCWPWLWGSGKTTVFWQKLGLVSAVIPRRDSNISSYWILAFSMWGSKNQLHLGPLDFDPDLGYVRYFWGIDQPITAQSQPHPLNNTDTLSGRFPWPVI